jgi:hypothetical protein
MFSGQMSTKMDEKMEKKCYSCWYNTKEVIAVDQI